ncbi:hypothetical protein ABE79_12775 [Proteus mirabilis]|nr:hypothetical protein ABE79_12775 [Proteus mirabilis]
MGDALVLIQQLFSVGAWASLQAEGLTLFMFWGLFLLYPCFVTLRDIVARLEKRVPWYVYPLPLALILTIIFHVVSRWGARIYLCQLLISAQT